VNLSSLKWLGILTALFSFSAQSTPASKDCIQDLNYLPNFLLSNDTGAKDHLKQKGQKHFNDALHQAITEAKLIKEIGECKKIAQRYLKSWRSGHLSIDASEQMKQKLKKSPQAAKTTEKTEAKLSSLPQIEFLSEKSVLVTLSSFAPANRLPLIQLLKDNHQQLAATPNWIIDVRRNGGGSDSSYTPLLPWLIGSQRVEVGMEWLVTPENTAAQQQICQRYDPDNKECFEWADSIVKVMQTGVNGQFIQKGETITFKSEENLEPKRPSRVAILISRSCGSSCEQFLLTARQSFNVKLLGRRTYGSLDYSNLRPHLLPSGYFELSYATSKSLRLPHLPVDIAGVIPDIYLPSIENGEKLEVIRVKNWLEGGSLALDATHKTE
jgi:hypothetical protein